jgi:integrase
MLRLFGRYLVERSIDKTLDTVAPEDVEAYQRHLVTVRKVGFSSFNQTTCALRFFYQSCLGKTDWTIARMPYQKKRRVLPEILSPEEIAAIFEACHNLKHKTLLMTSYSGGLRLGETGAASERHRLRTMIHRAGQGPGPLRDAIARCSRALPSY